MRGSWLLVALALTAAVLGAGLLTFKASTGSTITRSWRIEVVDNKVDVGMYTSIALDASGNPHIAYLSGRTLKYAEWTSSTWRIEVIDNDTWWNTEGLSLALDAGGNPHVSYSQFPGPTIGFEPVPPSRLKYAKRASSGWSIEIVDDDGVWPYPSLALDENNNPHMSYYGSDNLKYTKWTGSAWDIQVIDDNLSVGGLSFSSLVLDKSGDPHISYYDRSNSVIKYASWSGENWFTENVDNVGHLIILLSAFDSDDILHMSYCDGMSGDLKYAKRTPAGWLLEKIDNVPASLIGTGLGVVYHSIAVDSSGNPHVSYSKYERNGGRANAVLKYAKRSTSTWKIETIDNNLGWVAFSSIAIDAQGNPHISYLYFSPLKYATISVVPSEVSEFPWLVLVVVIIILVVAVAVIRYGLVQS
jgi:hypothetical protein